MRPNLSILFAIFLCVILASTSNTFASNLTSHLLRLGTNLKQQKQAINAEKSAMEVSKAFGKIALEFSILITTENERVFCHPLWKWILSLSNDCGALMTRHYKNEHFFQGMEGLPKSIPGPRRLPKKIVMAVTALVRSKSCTPFDRRVPCTYSSVSRAHLWNQLSSVDILHNVCSGKYTDAYNVAKMAENSYIPWYNYVPNRDLLFYFIASIAEGNGNLVEARIYHKLVADLYPESYFYQSSLHWLKEQNYQVNLTRNDISKYLQSRKPSVFFDVLRVIRHSRREDVLELLMNAINDLKDDEIKIAECFRTIGVVGDKKAVEPLERMLSKFESTGIRSSIALALTMLGEHRFLPLYVKYELEKGDSLQRIDKDLREMFSGGPVIHNRQVSAKGFSVLWKAWMKRFKM